MKYSQFCPIAKASEIIGEKWTILIVRELLMGSTRFNGLQRGLGLISPTLLSKRLVMLEDQGLIYRKKIPGQRSYEYLPTDSCKELLPILLSLGNWGMRWTQSNLTEADYDVNLLMLYLERSIMPDKLPGIETVIQFHFSDLAEASHWWVIVNGNSVDVCTSDPGRDVDIYFNTTVQTMTEVWKGTLSYRKAVAEDQMLITGPRILTGNVTNWLHGCVMKDLPPAAGILG